ncbi:MAG TPA: rhodanese-related sulfurtransferase [Rhodobacteraceae bacterium]|nr:rhodanese-related sulfurtransferase [Paracoccaceae bacterium]
MKNSDFVVAFEKLQSWYSSNCDGDWEHQFGVQIETLDNPGWCVTVDLDGTLQENQPFMECKEGRLSESEWIHIRKVGSKIKGSCGPNMLGNMVFEISKWLEVGKLF